MAPIVDAPARSHLPHCLRALDAAGWRVYRLPAGGRLVRNGQPMVLRSPAADVLLRLFVYKVTGSGRHRPDERRIEITTTYQKGLATLRGHSDVVLGYDPESEMFVGVDPRRLEHGGPTGNASSFFDRDGLTWSRADRILVRPRATKLFQSGIEFHAFFGPPRLAEYLFNFQDIHEGTYSGVGVYSGRSVTTGPSVVPVGSKGSDLILVGPSPVRARRLITQPLLDAYERGDSAALRRKSLGPDDLVEIRRLMLENGRLGEEFVLNHERRALRKSGQPALAAKVSPDYSRA